MRVRSTYQRAAVGLLASASALALVVAPASAAAKHATKHGTKSLGTLEIGVGLPLQTDAYPLYYGIATGMFQRAGINVQTTDLTPAAGVSALYSGSINILFDGTGTLNEAVTTHAVKAIGTYSEVPVWFVAQPSSHLGPITKVSQIKELDGKIIGASTPGSLVTDVEQSLVRAAHATASFDYLGSASGVVAVEHGLVTVNGATPANLPAAKAAGLQVLGSLNTLTGGRGLYTIVGANNEFVKKHGAILRAFNTVYHAALKSANKNVAKTDQVLATDLGISTSEAAVGYALQKRYTFLKPVSLTEIRYDLNNIASVLPAASKATYAEVVDNKALFG